MRRMLVVSFTFTVLLLSCALFESNSFQGEWEMVLEGDYSGTTVFNIDDDNNLKGTSVVNVNGYDYDVMYKGKVSEEGDLTGLIEARGQQVGELTGKIDFEKGSGNWSAAGMTGNWKASKSGSNNE